MNNFQPLSAELAERFYGSAPARTQRGYAYIEEGQVLAVFGIYHDPASARYVAFFDLSKATRTEMHTVRRRRQLLKGIRLVMDMIGTKRAPVHALSQPGIEAAASMLERIGFEPVPNHQGIYQWQAPQPTSQQH